MSSSQVVELCQILVESNLQLCESIEENSFDVQSLYNHFKWTAKKINKLSKMIKKNDEIHDTKLECKEEQRAQYNDEEYNKLIDRIEKLKQERQNQVKNDKKWSEMDDENDELIGRLKRLKPVELVEEPESDIYEILDQEEEEERKKDECYEERERQDQLNRIEPDKSDPEYKFKELNNYANELLLNRRRMKKQEFIKKLDIYMIIMRKKLINESEKCKELNKIITGFKHKLQERRKIPVEVIKLMLQWVKESSE